ncbi:hypothetical protein BXZ70DRAFT_1009436 [Cristinia sonorae]|uniref:Uncharacterized protein n=1 Tax=Cristinia sonorae TaxID=1940300 RepID=A0A8K0UKA6_9AGAR|nr:hypothetical protein BXZ70DRAFT_1009436 [Cristinia sonorae]
MSSDKTPTYIYKLVPHTSPPPTPLPLALPVSPLDQNDKFIHLSTSIQVPRTLRVYFKTSENPSVYVLRIPYERVAKDIRWEDPRGQSPGEVGAEGIFPHLYNGLKVGREEVESVKVLESREGENGWEEALKGVEDWLVY